MHASPICIRPLGVKASLVSLRTAEMIKYASNAFHAVKISFANEIGALSEQVGVDGHEVMATLCEDVKLNISAAYLKPGFAFGGSCLPKDLRALVYRAAHLDLKLPLLESAMPSNEQHLRRAIDAVLDLPAQRIGVIGLAFKEDTDDLRESPVVTLLEQLIGKGPRRSSVRPAHPAGMPSMDPIAISFWRPFHTSAGCSPAAWTRFWSGRTTWCWRKNRPPARWSKFRPAGFPMLGLMNGSLKSTPRPRRAAGRKLS
jgi:hypothetical protein